MSRLKNRYRLAKFLLFNPSAISRYLSKKNLDEIELYEIEKHTGIPEVIVEAGACRGEDTLRFVERWMPKIIYAFEPIPELYEYVYKKSVVHDCIRPIKAALSNKSGQSFIHISTEPNGQIFASSSLLRPREHTKVWPSIAFENQIQVDCINLDDFITNNKIKKIDILWLDLQGFEYEVLAAAEQTLKITKAVVTEVHKIPLYEGSGSIKEIKKLMKLNNFDVKVQRLSPVDGNILFVKNE